MKNHVPVGMNLLFNIAVLILWFLPGAARAELSVSLYSGFSSTYPSDLEITDKDRLHLFLRDVRWKNESFRYPPYYGLRITYWRDKLPRAGFGLDFTHTKAVTDPQQRIKVSGDRGGTPVDEIEPIEQTAQNLSFSHGLNFIMFNLYYRWHPEADFRPHAGIGAGILLPHVEGRIENSSSDEFRYGGTAVQILGGFEATLVPALSLFAEYKLHYAWLDTFFNNDVTLSSRLWTHQFALGLSLAIQTK